MNATLHHDSSSPHLTEIPRERASDVAAMRRRDAYLAAALRLSRTGGFGWRVPSGEVYWCEETFRIFEYDLTTEPTMEAALRRVHPEDAQELRQTLARVAQEREKFDFEFRLLLPNGSVKYLRAVAHPERDATGGIEFVGAVMDITAAREAEEKIRLIINTVPARIWTVNACGRLDFISQGLLDYFGEVATESLGQEPGLHVHPDEAFVFQSQWRQKMAEGKSFELEIRLRRFDGEFRWFLCMASPLFDRDGKIAGWYGNNIDIHERKQAEEKLRESEAYLAEAQRLSRTASWAWSPTTNKLRYWSEENYRLTGLDKSDRLPPFEAVLEHVPPDDRERFLQVLQDASARKVEFAHEFRFMRPDGEVREFCSVGHPVLDAAGNLVEYVGTLIDQTERKKAEEALRLSEERLRLIVDNLPGMLCSMDSTGELEFVNQRLQDYFGKSLAGLKNWGPLVHPEDLPRVSKLWGRCIETGQVYDVEHRVLEAEGVFRWIHVNGLPLRDDEGRIVRWYVLITDIDDRKKAEAALDKAQMELAHITRITTMGELAASIAHEVNQPLAAVVNNANACLNLLSGDAPNLAEVREALAEIVEDADRAGAVLARIRQMAKRTPCEKSPLDLRAVIADVLLLARGESSARMVPIRTEVSDEALTVFGDRVQLQQVLLNLVVNGMDAMGSVPVAKRSLLISGRRENGHGRCEAMIRVRDSGTGLDLKNRDRLFEAFYTTKSQGMGMGLSISRAIIEAHGGRLWAEQNEGGGASFLFALPANTSTP